MVTQIEGRTMFTTDQLASLRGEVMRPAWKLDRERGVLSDVIFVGHRTQTPIGFVDEEGILEVLASRGCDPETMPQPR